MNATFAALEKSAATPAAVVADTWGNRAFFETGHRAATHP
jgi:hypothetical protein